MHDPKLLIWKWVFSFTKQKQIERMFISVKHHLFVKSFSLTFFFISQQGTYWTRLPRYNGSCPSRRRTRSRSWRAPCWTSWSRRPGTWSSSSVSTSATSSLRSCTPVICFGITAPDLSLLSQVWVTTRGLIRINRLIRWSTTVTIFRLRKSEAMPWRIRSINKLLLNFKETLKLLKKRRQMKLQMKTQI